MPSLAGASVGVPCNPDDSRYEPVLGFPNPHGPLRPAALTM